MKTSKNQQNTIIQGKHWKRTLKTPNSLIYTKTCAINLRNSISKSVNSIPSANLLVYADKQTHFN